MAFGEMRGAYLGKDQVNEIDEIVRENPDIYSSRNHFIRAAIEHRIRFENSLNKFKDPERSKLRQLFLRTEVFYGKPKTGKD